MDDVYRHDREKEKARRMFDSSEARKAFENVLNHDTLMSLLKLEERGTLERIQGVLESGKESVVFLVEKPDGEKALAKIYMNQAGGFRDMEEYLRGDKRFRDFKSDRRSVMKEWCRKEFSNLRKASKVLRCPEAIAFQENVLVMEMIGRDGKPFPKLKEVVPENPEEALDTVLQQMKELLQEEQLVHGDLSEYNVLINEEGEMVWIDFSQGVHKTHPEASRLLERDVENITDFFGKHGSDTSTEEALEKVIPGTETSEPPYNL